MPKRKTVDKDYRYLTQVIDIKALQRNVRNFFCGSSRPTPIAYLSCVVPYFSDV